MITTFILEIIILCITTLIATINLYKIRNISSEIMKESFLNLLSHPIDSISKMISEKNPVLIIGTIIVLVYMIYVVNKSSYKSTYKIEEKYAVHGSSRFANNKEIFVENETIGVPIKQMLRDLEASMVIGCENIEKK